MRVGVDARNLHLISISIETPRILLVSILDSYHHNDIIERMCLFESSDDLDEVIPRTKGK